MAGNTILVAYDGSDGAQAAVTAAARLFPAHVATVVSIWNSVGETSPAGIIAVPAEVVAEAAAQLDESAERQARALAEEGAGAARAAGLEADARALRCHGNTWATLVRAAEEEEPAAIVIGSRGRSAVKSLLLGSVSSGVAHHARVPVVIVPPGAAR